MNSIRDFFQNRFQNHPGRKIIVDLLSVLGLALVAVFFFQRSPLQDLFRVALTASFLCSFVILAAEVFGLGWQNSSLKRFLLRPSGSTSTDLFYFLLAYCNLGNILALALGLNFVEFLKKTYPAYFQVGINSWSFSQIIANPFVSFGVYLLGLSLINYWSHRIFHRIPALWELHKVHHSAEEMNVVTLHRDHPLAGPFHTLLAIIPSNLLGVPIETYAVIMTLSHAHQLLVHSSFKWDWGWFGNTILASPKYHHLHHSASSEDWDRNFATMFPIWDHLFRTFKSPKNRSFIFGNGESEINTLPSLFEITLQYLRFLKAIFWNPLEWALQRIAFTKKSSTVSS